METSSVSAFKIAVDFVLLAIPGLIALILNLFVTPFQRNFFCNDLSIMYPYKPDTITTLQLALVGVIVSVVFVFIVELIHKFNNSYKYDDDDDKESKILYKWNISPFIQNLYQYIGLLLFGISINQFITDGTKFVVGRLRPHFMDVCRPVLSNGLTCKDLDNWNTYISDYTCTNQDVSDWTLTNARISFPSGHASFSFYCSFFCAFYIQSRMKFGGSKLLKHFIQLVFVTAALYTGLSRITDYKHHPTDVIAGSILGILIAFVVCFYFSDLFKRKINNVLPR
ncbi:hypothetical protein PVAND_005320 [Polypedilum vanderplanki]|uniref:Phosphatidic acid phosphatase type 2/haloperoxidase domain-containing protein n=1 Tax=Polypedilum vanderplanki TaxID=319348 RepID=A0A9J6BZT7_POLVA|nr:hypothetical protein PVAND_005320 [Polypedilum vanderplanki]